MKDEYDRAHEFERSMMEQSIKMRKEQPFKLNSPGGKFFSKEREMFGFDKKLS